MHIVFGFICFPSLFDCGVCQEDYGAKGEIKRCDHRMRDMCIRGGFNNWWRHPIHSTGFAVVALICYLVGLVLFFAARNALLVYRSKLSFTPDLPAWMLHKGIYSVVRHPFFLAFFFTWLGGALAVHYLRTSSTTIIMMMLYWSAAKMQERKFENSPLASEYRIYKSTTGMFLPSLKLFR